MHTGGIVILTLFINASTTEFVLKQLGKFQSFAFILLSRLWNTQAWTVEYSSWKFQNFNFCHKISWTEL